MSSSNSGPTDQEIIDSQYNRIIELSTMYQKLQKEYRQLLDACVTFRAHCVIDKDLSSDHRCDEFSKKIMDHIDRGRDIEK